MDRNETARRCAMIEKAGGDVLEFLRCRGCISPRGTWYRLQKEELGRTRTQITEGHGEKDMKKLITDEMRDTAIDMAIRGENPVPYLGECGSKAPQALWYLIREELKDHDPERYALLPDRTPKKKKDVDVKAEKTGGIQVSAVQTNVGEFSLLKNLVVYRTRRIENGTETDQEIGLPADVWERLAQDLPRVLRIFAQN